MPRFSKIGQFSPAAILGALKIESKPLRTVLRWQLYTAAAMALVAGILSGMHGAFSAALGGVVSWAAGLVFALMVSGSRIRSAGETLRILFRAEASKVMLMIFLLWLVLTTYQDVVPAAFFAGFVAAVLVSQAALLVRES
jgi:ATP synthase protein I